MKIRNATENDLPEILEIFNYEIIHTSYVYIYEPWTMEYVTEWFRKKRKNNFPFLVVEIDNQVAGYATFGKFRDRPAYDSTVEYSVYIHQDHRRKGIALQLVQRLIEIAKEQGRHSIIGGLDAGNKPSYEFHKRLGFTEVAHIKSVATKFDKWLDLVLFQLILE